MKDNKIIIDDKEYFDLVNWALDEKLRPRDYEMSSFEVKKMYLLVSSFFIEYFFKGLSKYYKKKIFSDNDIERIYLYNPRNFIVRKVKNFLNLQIDIN